MILNKNKQPQNKSHGDNIIIEGQYEKTESDDKVKKT